MQAETTFTAFSSASLTHQVLTGGGVDTHIEGTLIQVHLTVDAFKASRTLTGVGLHLIVAESPILTRVVNTVIDVRLTVPP